MDSIIERIWFSAMGGRESIRFIYILFPARYVLSVAAKLSKIYNKPTLNQTVFNKFCFLRTQSNEGGGEGRSKTVLNKYANFLYLPFSKNFTRQCITLVKNKWSRTKTEG